MGVLRSIIGDGLVPNVIVTDKEMTLMKAINMVFPDATNFLCIWHISKNVLARCKKLFETKEKWDKFNMCWNMLVSSSIEEEYIQHLFNDE